MRIQDRNLDDVLGHLRLRYDSDLPNFSDCIRAAFAEVDAVFWREQYLAFFWKCVTTVPGYVQSVIIANSVAESDGSRGLHDLWTRVRGSELEDGIRNHFQDESRHARLFLHLTDLAFPEFLQPTEMADRKARLFNSQAASKEKSEAAASVEYVIDNMVQMNIGEIRTRAHMFMIGPVLTALAPRGNKERVDGILSGLVYDEVTHIGYTAVLMEQMCQDGHKKLIADFYKRRLRDFNVYTIEQTRRSLDLYGEGQFPEVLEV